MKVGVSITILIVAFLTGLTAWGYWHASTHAALDIQIRDFGLASEYQQYDSPHHASLELFDGLRSPLALAKTVEPHGFITVLHPTLGDCSSIQAVGGKEYSACYSKYSRWASGWAGRTQLATFKVGNCIIKDVPVSLIRSKTGWQLWWVPLPHIGGTPFEYIELQIEVDSNSCTRVN